MRTMSSGLTATTDKAPQSHRLAPDCVAHAREVMAQMSEQFQEVPPAWVRQTCPKWCNSLHGTQTWGEDHEIHSKHFGWQHCDDVVVNVTISRDGVWQGWEALLETSVFSDSRDVREMARTLCRARQWIQSHVEPRTGLQLA